MNENEIQANQSIIDFNKTIITICSSILTAFISFIVYQNTSLSLLNYLVLGMFVLAIFISLFGFGSTIGALRDNNTNTNKAILATNTSAIIMIVAILLLSTFKIENEQDLNNILKQISKSSNSTNKHLNPDRLKKLKYKNEKYEFLYKSDSTLTKVIYSIKEKKIISIE
jgi:hypothetical protein